METLLKRVFELVCFGGRNAYKNLGRKREIRSLLSTCEPLDPVFKKQTIAYWRSHGVRINLDWHRFYASKNGRQDPRYIPEDLYWTKILPVLNRSSLGDAYADKALLRFWFPSVRTPETIAVNMSSFWYDDELNPLRFSDVVEHCTCREHLIIKPTIDSGSGKGIEFVSATHPEEMEDKITRVLTRRNRDVVVQSMIQQHEVLASLNPSSVNTVRTMSLLLDGEVIVLSSRVRIGINESKCDHKGIVCGVTEEGYLQDFACVSGVGDILYSHPQGHRFAGVQIPGFHQMNAIVKREHTRFGHFRLIAWDFAVDKKGEPILVEFNVRSPGMRHAQLLTGPLFGHMTSRVLGEVFGHEHR